MLVKVRVTIIWSTGSFKQKVFEGTMCEIPMISRAFTITTKGDKPKSFRIIESTKVTRILCVFPNTVWVQTEKTLFKLEVLQGSDRLNSTFLRYIPFF